MVIASIGKIATVAPYSGHMFESVARSASERLARPGPKNSTNLPTTPCLRSRSVTVSTRSVAVVPAGNVPSRRKPTHRRNQHRDRLAEHRGLGLDAAHAPPDHTQSVHHRRMRVGADERVRIRPRHPAAIGPEDDAREVLEVHLVHDAGLGRHDAEVGERVLPPAQERVALAVARVLELRVQVKRVSRAEMVHLDGVIDHEFHRLERIDAVRVAAEAGHGVAHRGEIDDGRHAREILQQHTRWGEGDLLLDRRSRGPSWRAPGCRRA